MKKLFFSLLMMIGVQASFAQTLEKMQWFNEPEQWEIKDKSLSMFVTPQSDYWRISHYGFTVDDAPFYYATYGGEFEVKVKVTGDYKARFDQAGLMLRIDHENYIKAGIEFVDGKFNLSTVVTHKTSDWSVITLDKPVPYIWIKAVRRLDARKMEPVTLDLTESETDALLNIEPASNYTIRVRMLDPADTNEVIAESLLTTRDLFDAAKRLYINKDDLAAYKAEAKGRRDQERARQEEAGKWQALARQELEAFDSWPLVTRLKDLGLTIRERKMADGGRLIIAVDDLTRFSGHVDGFQYRECFAVRRTASAQAGTETSMRWNGTSAGTAPARALRATLPRTSRGARRSEVHV